MLSATGHDIMPIRYHSRYMGHCQLGTFMSEVNLNLCYPLIPGFHIIFLICNQFKIINNLLFKFNQLTCNKILENVNS